MELDLVCYLRNCLVVGSILTTASLVPGGLDPFVQPVVRSWKRFRHFTLVLKERFQRKGQNSFWEIDMTNFEP